MHSKEYEIEIAGKKIVAMFSDLAEQAQGSVIVKCEDTVVLATAVMGRDTKNNPGFFNLTVEYMERFYASGMILGGQYNKREGRPSDKAILASRVIDRTIRPLFAHHIKNAVQVVVTVLSVGKMDPSILAVNAVSLALGVSPIPWDGPVGAVQVGIAKKETETLVNNYIPNNGEIPYDLDITVCGKDGNVVMIEASASQLPEASLTLAMDMALNAISQIEIWQKEIIAELGKKKHEMPKPENDPAMISLFDKEIKAELEQNLFGEDSKKRLAKRYE